MKRILVILFQIGLFTVNANAAGGDSVGRGGVVWACQSPSGVLRAAWLTDLYEARVQYPYTLIKVDGTDPMVIYQARRAWLTKFLPEFAGVLAPRFDYVEKHLNFVHAELLPTLDYNLAVRPLKEDCGGLEWKPENIANFREEDQEILISAELWASPLVPTLDKAALLFHEAVYYWMRTYYGSTDSDKSRHLVGILFSTLSPEQMKAEIIKVLGTYPDQPDGKAICLMTNSARNQIYVAYDQNTDDAELTVRMRCQDDADAKWCIPTSIECENIVPGPQHRCISENSVTHKIYVGKGRGLLEAQFNAHMSCYMGSLAQGASTHDCPDRSFMECN